MITRCTLIWSASLFSSLSCSSYSKRRPVGFKNRFFRDSISVSNSLFCCSSDRTFVSTGEPENSTRVMCPVCICMPTEVRIMRFISWASSGICTASERDAFKRGQIRQMLSKMALKMRLVSKSIKSNVKECKIYRLSIIVAYDVLNNVT